MTIDPRFSTPETEEMFEYLNGPEWGAWAVRFSNHHTLEHQFLTIVSLDRLDDYSPFTDEFLANVNWHEVWRALREED